MQALIDPLRQSSWEQMRKYSRQGLASLRQELRDYGAMG